jgi:hypothetical protein
LRRYQCSQFLFHLLVGKCKGSNIPFGNYHIVDPGRDMILMETEELPHNTLDAVALDTVAHFLAHGKAQSPGIAVLPMSDKEDEMRRKIPTAPRVTHLKLGPPDKMIRFGENYTANRFRPLARLLLRTARPFLVAERTKKPWVLFRLVLLG